MALKKTRAFNSQTYDAHLNGGKSPSEALAELAVQFALQLRANNEWDEAPWHKTIMEFAEHVKMGRDEKARLKAELKQLARLIALT